MSATSNLRPALSSNLFRNRSHAEVAARAKELGFEAVEWGGDAHVSAGDLAKADEAACATRDAGLEVAAYRSLYRLLLSHGEGEDFADSVAVAAALGAPRILLRAGFKSSAATTPVEQGLLRKEALKVVEQAAAQGIEVVFEFRESTWCDSPKSALALAAIVPQARLDWAFLPGTDPALATDDVAAIVPHLACVHVSYQDAAHRLSPLADGAAFWSRILLQPALPSGGWAVLDRTCGDEDMGLKADAEILLALLGRS